MGLDWIKKAMEYKKRSRKLYYTEDIKQIATTKLAVVCLIRKGTMPTSSLSSGIIRNGADSFESHPMIGDARFPIGRRPAMQPPKSVTTETIEMRPKAERSSPNG
jgi:hypothetical protein